MTALTDRDRPPGPASPGDGRHRRRAQNREAVIDAMLALLDAGVPDPGIAEIAEAAALSVRSVFRYFDDAEDLTRAAIARQRERLAPVFDPEVDPAASFDERVQSFVDHRIRLLEAMGQVGRIARRRAATNPTIAEHLERVRAQLRDQVGAAFAPELDWRPGPEAARCLAAADVVASFESYELLRHDHDITTEEARATMAWALGALLAPGSGRAG